MSAKTVAVIGASAHPERYSYRCVVGYHEHGYTVWPVHPSAQPVADLTCYASIEDMPGHADIISLYVNPGLGLKLLESIKAHAPEYVWLNPGADSDELEQALTDAGLRVMRSCNLVALSIGDPLELARGQTGRAGQS